MCRLTYSSMIRSGPRALVLLDPLEHVGSHPLISSTISPPKLPLPKKPQSSFATLLVPLRNLRKSQPRRTRVLSTLHAVLSNVSHRLRMMLCCNLKPAHDKCRLSPRNRNVSILPDTGGLLYLEMKTIFSALHHLKPFGQVHRHEPEGEKLHT